MDSDLFICKTKALNGLAFDKVIHLEHEGNIIGKGLYEVEFSMFRNSNFKNEVCEMNYGGYLVMMVLQKKNIYSLKTPKTHNSLRVIRKSFLPLCGRYIIDEKICIDFSTKIFCKKLKTRTLYKINNMIVFEAHEGSCDKNQECINFLVNTVNLKIIGFSDFYSLLTLCIREELWGVPDWSP